MRRSPRLPIPAAAATAFIVAWNLTPVWNGSRTPAAGPSVAVHYAGCNEARASGKAPLYRGQPGYREEMDGDGDGIACEPHRFGG